jgi:DNA polymerase
MRDSWGDLETRCATPLKHGSWVYAETAEVMLWAYALEDGQIKVWDLLNKMMHWQDDMTGLWEEAPCPGIPADLELQFDDPDIAFWFHNGVQFDFPVLEHALPRIAARIPQYRRRDTMVQAYCHGMPGALDKLGAALNIDESKRKDKRGKALVQLFCVPKKTDNPDEIVWNTKQTHPKEWQEFIQYAGQDIVVMREAHRKLPNWNYKGRQLELAHLDAKINARGFAIDRTLAEAVMRASTEEKARLAKRTQEITEDEVKAATQRDALLRYIVKAYGVDLPDMKSDTLERRLNDPDLPVEVKDLIGIRLQASMNSSSKAKTLLKGVCRDNRLRGGAQFRGAFRTGRWAHRLFQHGNMPRMDPEPIARWFGIPKSKVKKKHILQYVSSGIESLIAGCEDITHGEVMRLCAMVIRGLIVAGPGKKLCIADLANIEGRGAAWAAGEEWKIQAYLDYDTIIGETEDGEPIRKGADLYKVAYAEAFRCSVEEVVDWQRQIGKVMELMLQYQGGVGAFITGAATYGIDLDEMAEIAWPNLPADVIEEAQSFLQWLYDQVQAKHRKRVEKAEKKFNLGPDAPDFVPMPDEAQHRADFEKTIAGLEVLRDQELIEARHGLDEKVFVVCDSLKRLWRRAHPAIAGTRSTPSYWTELEDTVRYAILNPGVTLPCRKVKIRRDGGWLRIVLPSGRALCYPSPKLAKDGTITYMGQNQYSKNWERLSTYGGKIFENIVQAIACDQLAECMPTIEEAGYPIVFHVHDEDATETPDDPRWSAEELARLMCSHLGWNEGLPLAAEGFETKRYRK